MPDIELKALGSSARPPPRHPDTSAPGSLGRGYRDAEERAKAAVHLQDAGLDVTSIFGLGLAGWFTFLSLPLLLFPRLLVFLTQTSSSSSSSSFSSAFSSAAFSSSPPPYDPRSSYDRTHTDSLTLLESLLVQLLGIGLVALALISLFVIVPSYTPPPGGRVATTAILTGLSSIVALIGWNAGGGLAGVVGLGNACVALWGWWVILFGNEKFNISKKKNKDARHKHL